MARFNVIFPCYNFKLSSDVYLLLGNKKTANKKLEDVVKD